MGGGQCFIQCMDLLVDGYTDLIFKLSAQGTVAYRLDHKFSHNFSILPSNNRAGAHNTQPNTISWAPELRQDC